MFDFQGGQNESCHWGGIVGGLARCPLNPQSRQIRGQIRDRSRPIGVVYMGKKEGKFSRFKKTLFTGESVRSVTSPSVEHNLERTLSEG